MILVTVGTQLPFDRLVSAVDKWAGTRCGLDVFAQTGTTDDEPKNVRWARQVPPGDFRKLFEQANAIVAHAGIGTILTALELGKPILIMPRKASLGEQRNDHQLATARRFEGMGYVNVAWNEEEVAGRLDAMDKWCRSGGLHESASPELVRRVREFLYHAE